MLRAVPSAAKQILDIGYCVRQATSIGYRMFFTERALLHFNRLPQQHLGLVALSLPIQQKGQVRRDR
jgi:hypothetical protein